MSRRRRTVALVALLCSLLGMSGVAAAQMATASPVLCDQYASSPIQCGRYIVMNNRWGTSATQCIDVTSNGFTVTQADGSVATNGAPKSYPAVYYGCHYGNCTTNNNILSPNGLQASDSRFAGISTSVSMSYPSSGTYDAAYDIWFNKSRPSTTTGQNDGAEVMVWLNRVGSIQPIGSKIGTANIAGATWDVWSGNIGWNVISYVRQQSTSSLSFSVSSFWNDVVSRGLGSNSWYLTSIQAGFEPWIGGAGLAVNNFSVTTGGSQPTQNPTPTSRPSSRPTAELRDRGLLGDRRDHRVLAGRVPDRGHREEHRLVDAEPLVGQLGVPVRADDQQPLERRGLAVRLDRDGGERPAQRAAQRRRVDVLRVRRQRIGAGIAWR